MWLLDTVNDSVFKQNVLRFSPTSELVQLKSIQRYKGGQGKHCTIYNIMRPKQNKNNLDGKVDSKWYLSFITSESNLIFVLMDDFRTNRYYILHI